MAWHAYHAGMGTAPLKRKPSFKRFCQCLVPKRLPSPAELGRKLDNAMYAIKRHWQRKKMMEG